MFKTIWNTNKETNKNINIIFKGLNENDVMYCPDMIGGAEDIEMGRCLANLNVTSGDTRFEFKREQFWWWTLNINFETTLHFDLVSKQGGLIISTFPGPSYQYALGLFFSTKNQASISVQSMDNEECTDIFCINGESDKGVLVIRTVPITRPWCIL